MNVQKLTEQDTITVLHMVPVHIIRVLREYPVFLAGGFIRAVIAGEEVSDMDLFSNDAILIKSLVDGIKDKVDAKVHQSENAYTILAPPRLPIQFITRWLYDDPVKLIEQFDFSICQAAIWWDKEDLRWKSVCSDRFYSDLASRRLFYTFPKREEDGGGSLLRAFKFSRKGYNIQAESMAGVCARLLSHMQVDPQKTIQDLGEEWLAGCLAKLIREVDPLHVIDGMDLAMEPETVEF